MKFQKIDFFILIQILLLAFTPALFYISLQNQALVLTRFALILIWLIQIVLLYRYLKRSENKLRQIVKVIGSGDDYQLLRKRELSSVHAELLADINKAIARFRDLKIEKEADLQFFQLVMEYVPAGVIVLSGNNHILIINSTALELLGVKELSNPDQLDRVKPGLKNWFNNIPVNNHTILELDHKDRSLRLSVSFSTIRVRDESMKIYSLKDIKREVDHKELETWHRMLRILSHEVVNSVSPITLSSMGMQRNIMELKKIVGTNDKTESIISEVEVGLSAISERGKGLNEFVESVQKLTRIPEPDLNNISLGDLIKESSGIMNVEMKQKDIKLNFKDSQIHFNCDKKLIVQVLINIIRNSMEAFGDQDDKSIWITGKSNAISKIIQIEDNGPGIPEVVKKQMFSPFFSTKERGSGLGLSFSRQVMRLHNGDISIWSEPGKAIFTLSFPNEPDV